MQPKLYEHSQQGHTPISLAFLVGAIAFVLLGAGFDAPIYWYMPPGFALLLCAWWFMSNPNHGCRLTADELIVWANKDIQTFAMSAIAHIQQKAWMDGPDDFTIVMKSGEKHELSHLQFGNSEAFTSALEKTGIAVEQTD